MDGDDLYRLAYNFGLQLSEHTTGDVEMEHRFGYLIYSLPPYGFIATDFPTLIEQDGHLDQYAAERADLLKFGISLRS